MMTIHSIDQGFSRINYICKNGRETMFYCIQEESKGSFMIYRCSKDFEPSYPLVMSKEMLKNMFELPHGNTILETSITKFIDR